MSRFAQRNKSMVLCTTALALGCALIGFPGHASAEPRAFEIVAGEAPDTLKEFARQAELQTLFDYRLVRNLRTRAVSGDFEADEALKQMLTGTGLKFERINERTVAIRPEERKEETVAAGESATSVEESMSQGRGIRVAQADAGTASQPAGKAGAEEPSGEVLEEITVTAQKRVERLSDVPISISVLSGNDLDKSTAQGVVEALSRVPGVAMTESTIGGASQVTVRGVTAGTSLFAGSNPVGYYLDSVPFALIKSAIAPDANAYDLERVEVLRGPQGTLYGASALNGVVRILTQDADLNEFELKARTSVSSTKEGGENFRGDAALNVPLIEGKLAARAVVGYEDFSGWIDKPIDEDANDAEISTFRLKVNAQPNEQFSVGASVWISRADYGAASQAADGNIRNASLDEPLSTDYDVLGLKLGYDFSGFSIASMTSHVDYKSHSFLDFLGFLIESGLDSKVFTQEFNLNSTHSGAWRWTAGAMYREGEDRLVQILGGPPGGPPYRWHDDSESFAVFGELTRVFAEGRFELTGGLRYFEDEVNSIEPDAVPVYSTQSKFDAVTPRVILNWHPSDRATVYASYAEGFRSGFDQFLFAKTVLNFPPIEPDTLKNYELGTKGNSADGRFGYEAAVYFIDWQDVQQSLSIVPADGVPRAANTNGGSASGIGFEFAASTRPVEGLELGLNFSWNDLTADDQVVAQVFSNVTNQFEDLVLFDEGDRLNNSPEYTLGASVDYVFPLGGKGLNGRVAASANYTSEQTICQLLSATRICTVGDIMLIARTGFSVEAPEHWAVTLFVDNVTDEDGTPIKDPFAFPDLSIRVRPRTIGAQLEYRF